ncbi:hypothetical protein MMC09_005562 [Bachmanniomyces sp. S44760]|nr:hypothetical protein [Bachmanniomyces sp. S44760]
MVAQYPATTHHATGVVDSVMTNVMVTKFTDRIMVQVIQHGRLAQWVGTMGMGDERSSPGLLMARQIQVPLESISLGGMEHYLPSSSDEEGLMPMSHLQPKTLLGASNSEREMIGQLYATHIASAILTKDPDEKRTVLVGLGLSNLNPGQDTYRELLPLILDSLST